VREIKKDSDSRRAGRAPCVSDYPWIGGLMQVLEEEGLQVSISSIRADSLTEGLVSSLKRGGHRTLTVAPEAGTERLRHVIRKDITDAQIYEACDLVRQHGIPNLKCYFMIGLPTETDADIEAIPDLAARLLARLRRPSPQGEPFGRLTLSISSFRAEAVDAVPVGGLRSGQPARGEAADDQGGRPPPPQRARPPREPARGVPPGAPRARDRRVADFLEEAARRDGDWRSALREWTGDPDFYTHRERPLDETLPWDHLDVGVRKTGLLREHQRAGLSRSRRRRAEGRAGWRSQRVSRVDVQEHGANNQTSSRRLYMQLQAFGACDDPKRLTQALERAHVEGVLYADAADPLGVGRARHLGGPRVLRGAVAELLGTEPFLGLRRKPELTMFGRTYSSGYEADLEDWLLGRPRRTALAPEWPWAIWYPLRRTGNLRAALAARSRAPS
jgi:hypothetical protein